MPYENEYKQKFDLANLPFSKYRTLKTNFASFPARASHSVLKRICILIFNRAAPQTVTVLIISSVSVKIPWRHADDVSQLTRGLLHADASVWMDLNLMNLVSISSSQSMVWYTISHWLGVCSLAFRPIQKPLNWQHQATWTSAILHECEGLPYLTCCDAGIETFYCVRVMVIVQPPQAICVDLCDLTTNNYINSMSI